MDLILFASIVTEDRGKSPLYRQNLTRDIHEEVERRNRMLDHMGHNVRIDSRRFLRKKQQADVQTGRIFCGFLFIRLLPHKVPRIFYAKLRI
ncbi:hypothetical protein MLD38_027279 [Melastoma candidum]|uniref:Uncharacterized protein n=1 Tax=Melastoma candidum TaxID=119954 RepID=A0ACB9P343_9MYRT|nr:hypothetical protein MLD38_027279 [Melastoma candidum]